jgi:hypothetical protein
MVVLAAVLLLIPVHRLPAPIQELQESPTPAPASTKTPKLKKSPTRTKATPQPNESSKSPRRTAAPSTNRFAGKWIGTMPEVPWGDVPTELIVDQAGTTMRWQESGKQKGTSVATVNGDTVQASFQVGVTATWSLTPQRDGTTARVRLQAFMNDQTAIFQRVLAR